MRLLYCVGSLDKPGGTEKVLVNKCNYFVNNFDYEVHIITVNQLDKSYCYDWDEKIHFHDIEYNSSSSKLKNLFTIPQKISWFKKIYRNLISEINPDIVIVSERGYLDYVIPFICKNIPKVREFHSSKKAISIHAKQMNTLNKIQHIAMYSIIYKMFDKYDFLVLLTENDARESNYKTKIRVIPNMIPNENAGIAKLEKHNAISVGSMNGKIKGFDDQIRIWRDIVNVHPDWILNIYGDGGRKEVLQNQINDLKLKKNVILHGVSSNINEKYLDSSFSLFTSVGEGFGMVLIEAMSVGVPCIAFNCPHGPSEIITSNVDGFLVEPNDFNDFKEKIFLLIENKELRVKLGNNAKENVVRFYPPVVALKWRSFFEEILQEYEY